MDNKDAIRGNMLQSLLTVLFIGLKLSDVIDWSWWWVLSPLWLPLVILLGLIIIVLFLLSIVKFARFLVNK